MCRWFAYLSKEQEILLEDALVIPEHSLSRQVADHYLPYLAEYEPGETPEDTEKEITLRNRFFNADGLGVAWYDSTRVRFGHCGGRRPTLYKIVRQPLTDPNFLSICGNTASTAVFAHIRAATPGTAITGWNAHPFQFGRYVLMHNGDIAYWDDIKVPMFARMSKAAFNNIRGTTPGEQFAALMFTFLEEITRHKKLQRNHNANAEAEDFDLVDLGLQGQQLGDSIVGSTRMKSFDRKKLEELRVGDHKLFEVGKLGRRRVDGITLEEVERALPAWERRHDLLDIKKAMELTIRQIIVFQLEAAKEDNNGVPVKFQRLIASNLNIAVSDGHQLVAIRYRNHATEHPPSLYYSRTAGPSINRSFVGNPNDGTDFNPYALNFRKLKPASAHKKHFIICSEPMTYNEEDWELVGKNRGVMVDENVKEQWFTVNPGLDE